ncbi:Flp pilus assembly protein, pilin Flp [Candidatus Syntrophocurvum alkaliphilum]|uniref:Flp pilus assembly protein, pilin Flp n=1 Tax=Candidatus Syntrophocurvum alkaliphilum TaxID=2293317 RepID=A0A6I6DKR3_9FIRM|nr:Flp family type IVb pilin [Candidatus Syntrophocurvum alkaliphilum]QGU00115.1 Flp pilus assembly protein, pilin Flp [Candidatus Syntrophocurvum alkaliphilum]
MLEIIKRLFKEEEGQGMVEYGLILALVAIVAIGALELIGDGVLDTFTGVAETLSGEGE